MKSLLQNLGVLLIVIGAVILIACFATGNANDNEVRWQFLCLIVIARLISYINLNKRITDSFSTINKNKKAYI